MPIQDLISLFPLLILSASIVTVMLVAAFWRNHRLTFSLTLFGLILSLISLPLASRTLPLPLTSLLIIDEFAIFYIGLILVASLVVVVISFTYIDKVAGNKDEYYMLILLATLGACILILSDHFISFFLGLETLSLALFTMIAYTRFQRQRIEAAIKYLILAAAASAFLLFGMALVYIVFGTMQFSQMTPAVELPAEGDILLTIGLSMVIVGIGFKLALVPFQMWVPDVYQGAPAPVTAFIATVSKGGVFALFLRLFANISIESGSGLWNVIAFIAIASMLLGNVLALSQNNVKRILAYSSIAHFGYLLVAFLAGNLLAASAMTFYLVVYIITTLMAFGIISLLSRPEKEFEELENYRGLFRQRPGYAVLLTLSLLSLASLPPTGGLIGKIFLAAAGVEASLWLLLAALVIGTVIGVFYYLRIVITMFRQAELKEEVAVPINRSAYLTLILLSVILVILGIYPTPLMQLIERVVTKLG
ncbi:MAG TPA: NADH-quinone oxidoreductase subunit N [Anaerolineales bacterium]